MKKIMNSKTGKAIALLAVTAALSTTALAGSFEYHGYGRAGVILNSEGGQADAGGGDNGVFNFNWGHKPFTHSIGRLGNEVDNYYEGVLQNNFGAGKVSGKSVVRFAYKDHYYSSWNVKEDGVGVRELFTEMQGFEFAPSLKVWAGKRFYGREDVHINDWFVRIMDGTGMGMEMPVGPGTMKFAFIAANDPTQGEYALADEDLGSFVQKNYDLRYDMPALDGTLDLELQVVNCATDDNGNDGGLGVYVGYGRADYYMFASGFSKTLIQYGTDRAADLGTSYGFTAKDASALRLATFGVAELNENFKWMSNFVYETSTDKYGKDWDASWWAFTIRPEYYLNRNFAIVTEFGIEDMVEQAGNDDLDAMAMKFTVAPTLTLDNTSFWTRPQLRAFVSYGTWGDDLKGGYAFGGMQYSKETSGVTYGVQMETWF